MPNYEGMTPEQIREELIKRDEELETTKNDLKTATGSIESNAKRIQELEEHNQKLFLRVTTKVEDKQNNNDEPEKRSISGLIEKMEGEKK